MVNLEIRLNNKKPFNIDYNSEDWIDLPQKDKESTERKVSILNNLDKNMDKIMKYSTTAGVISSAAIASYVFRENSDKMEYFAIIGLGGITGFVMGFIAAIPTYAFYSTTKIMKFNKQEELISKNLYLNHAKHVDKAEYLK